MARIPDVRLDQKGGSKSQVPEAVSIDWLLQPSGALDESQALQTAVIVALGTDRRARRDDILPDPDETDLRGWWGDLEAAPIWDGWPIGTRLWLLRRAKITGTPARQGSTVAVAEMYAREAIEPFVRARICSKFAVKAERVGLDRIDMIVRLYRGPELAVDLRYQGLWDGIVPKDEFAGDAP